MATNSLVRLEFVMWFVSCGCVTEGAPLCYSSAVASFDYLRDHSGEPVNLGVELQGLAGYWQATDGLFLDAFHYDYYEAINIEIDYHTAAALSDEFTIKINGTHLLDDCAVFWSDGVIHETMNVVDGIFYAHLTIDTAGTSTDAPPECGPGFGMRLAIEGTEPVQCVQYVAGGWE